MEKHPKKLPNRISIWVMITVLLSSFMVSCKDIYLWDNEEPDWLGESIYDELNNDGNFTVVTRIIRDLDLVDVLSKTGSKTVFVANDDAFNRFFTQGNPWNVTSYEQMTEAQKRLLLNFSMINNAYLIETLSNYYVMNGGLQEGKALRRTSAVNVLDSVPYERGSQLPTSSYWDSRRSRGLWLLKDNTEWPLVHLLQKQMDFNNITDEDFRIMTGIDRVKDDAYLFSNKVTARDRACKNGYINELENVLIPPTNMAQYIRNNPKLSSFSRMLDRFCAPYYSLANTTDFRKVNENFPAGDSVFVMRYFTPQGRGGAQRYPSNLLISSDLMLPFDPGWNSYVGKNASLQSDMAVMFVPTNEALASYMSLTNTGGGRALAERYGTWDKVPTDILALFMARHMRPSLLNSIPSVFDNMVDEFSSKMNVKKTDIVDSLNYIGINGLVYVTNNLYPPDDYISVYGPVLFSKKTEVCRWAIRSYLYRLYLNSMVNSYAFMAPVDKAFESYIDPLTYGTNNPTMLKFWYDYQTKSVKASVFRYDKINDVRGDSVTLITDPDFIKSRLSRILDQSIVVNDFKDTVSNAFEDGYYFTKDGNFIKANNTSDIAGHTSSSLLSFQGGGDIQKSNSVNLVDSGIYEQGNGTTYLVEKIPQTPFQSVYSVLKNTPEFSEFYNICNEFPNQNVFIRKINYYGIDQNIKFFNTFRYTVYVPTNEAIQRAYAENIIVPWTVINAITTKSVRDSLINVMERFVRYHFQDNAVIIHPNQPVNELFQSATIKNDTNRSYWGTFKNKFFRIGVKTNEEGGLTLTTERYSTKDGAMVPDTAKTTGTLSNIMCRDYVFNLDPTTLNSLTTTSYSTSTITTSSTAVIHQIDKVLRFQ